MVMSRARGTRQLMAQARGARTLLIDQLGVSQLFRLHEIARPRSLVAHGLPILRRAPGSTILIGERVVLTSRRTDNELSIGQPVSLRTVTHSAQIEIGDDTGISGAVICAACSIHIGRRVLIGTGTMITDSDHHPVQANPVSGRRYCSHRFETAQPIVIGDDVFIGAGCILLKGSALGRGSVLGAGSVLSSVIAPLTIAAGNPARPIGHVDSD